VIEHLPALIPISLILFAFIAGILGMMKYRLSRYLAILGAVAAFGLSVTSTIHVLQTGTMSYHFGNWPPPYGIEFVMDTLTCFMVLVITGIGSILLMFPTKPGFMIDEQKSATLYTLVLLFMAGLCGMVMAGDLFNLYVFLEISSLTTFALVSIGGGKASVASFRYLIMASIGGCFYLLGVGFIYFSVGSINMADVFQLLPAVYDSPSVIGGAFLIITGLCLKMALFPFHTWLPDSDTYAPPVVAAFSAAVQIEVPAYVITRLLLNVFSQDFMVTLTPITDIIAWISAAGIIIASILAIAQNNFRRMLAYSSVAQVAYIGLGIGLANPLGIVGGIFHIMAHSLMKGSLFLIAGGLHHHNGIWNIQGFQGLGRRMPWTIGALTIAALGMIGIPPTAGFFSKWYLLLGSIDSGKWVFVAVMLISSLLNAVYFFRIIEKAFTPLNNQAASSDNPRELPGKMLAPILILATGILVAGALNVVIINNLIMPVAEGL
jgi:multicomponent Na+:H+ antiporter subunit D